ncbi:MAG: phosphoenolpyruvate--protein phosphotransferase [Ruminococcus sp.]|nr:phosphoenolpyruvate--protein phosphotransferase [Ruminococcus sp.]
MQKLMGTAVYGGIGRGKIKFFHRDEVVISRAKVVDTLRELRKFAYARNEVAEELKQLYEQAVAEVGEDEAQIFQIHQMILDDSQYVSSMESLILKDHYNAEYSVVKTVKMFSRMMEEMSSESQYISERIADIRDVSARLLRHLQNRDEKVFKLDEMSIVCADDFLPSETIRLDKSKVAAICTSYGSANSHTAILARTRGIPCIIGIGEELNEELENLDCIVDSYSGIMYIQPDNETTKLLDHKEAVEGRKRELLTRLRGRKNITRDGREIEVLANICDLSDIENAKENDCGGIGLLRSEYLYTGKTDFPDEEVQFYNYRRVLTEMHGKPVVIRTMDIGADAGLDYFGFENEKNPAIGFRSIRVCLARPQIFKTQLRALLRASVYGDLRILFPMIIDTAEVDRIKELLNEVKAELIQENIKFKEKVPIGVLIETPAAVMLSDLLAQQVDFFAIGTNDLEQFANAIYRHNPHFEKISPDDHICVLRMIKTVCDNAHAHNIKVYICGELGAETAYTEVFLDLHVDGLSVTPSNILPIRKTIRSLNLSDRRQVRQNIQKHLRC